MGMETSRKTDLPIRTLVVDDAPAMARAIRSFLEAQSETEVAGVARSGPEAIRMAGRLQPDLVLLDLFMPGMSGLDVVNGLKMVSPCSRIIIVTVLGEEMVGTCRGFGADGFVMKNRLHESLGREIERVFVTRE